MEIVITSICILFFANATVAFFVAFFWQAKVIFTIFGASDFSNAYVPWKALGDPNSPQVSFGRFFAGDIFPELRRKWGKAMVYVVWSYIAAFTVIGSIMLFGPTVFN